MVGVDVIFSRHHFRSLDAAHCTLRHRHRRVPLRCHPPQLLDRQDPRFRLYLAIWSFNGNNHSLWVKSHWDI